MTNTTAANLLLIGPVLIPLITAACAVLAGHGRERQSVIGLTGAALNFAAAAGLLTAVARHDVLVTELGKWPAPFGIAFAADRWSAIMVMLAATIVLSGAAFAVPTLARRARLHRFMPLLHLMLAGMGGFFLTADLFNLYVWFELVLVSSFGLMTLGGRRSEVEGAAKYFAINIVGSMLLLSSVGMLYAMTGTLNLADLAVRLQALDRPHMVTAVGGLVLVALGIKSAAFPLFFWLPASYHAPPIAVTAIFGGMLTKVGVYGLVRLFTLVFTQDVCYTHGLLLVVGGLTMITGVLGAVAQHDLRRLLSFHIISQIGYMIMGLGFSTLAGIAAVVFFMIHIVITKTALFFVSGMVERLQRSFDLDRIGGLYRSHPAVAALFLVPALSLGGIPPLSGFIGKLALIQAGFDAGRYVVVTTAIVVSLLTLYSMTKIWTQGFWSPREGDTVRAAKPVPFLLWSPPAVLAVLIIVLGLAAGPISGFAVAAAEQLVNRTQYIDAVLGRQGR